MSLRESVRERIARENQQKVLRRRAESRYLSTLAADLDIERLASLQAEVVQEAEARAIEAASQPLKPRVRADPSFVAAEPESLRVLKRFDLSAKCVAVTHGGATLWTGGADGIIMVRSGITGDEAYSIPTPDAGAVTTLFATATHVFAGFSNGLVRVFDHCAFVNITEGRFHSSAVTCFAPITRGGDTEHIQMLSAGDDGCLVKWDTEARGFAAMFKIDLQLAGGISCLCTHGQKAFAGSRNGTITMVDTVVAQIHDVIAAHTDGILALACTAAGYVFSGSSDNQLRVWRGAELVACHPTSSPILVIQVDDSNERVWSGEQDGTVRVWRANEADGFVLEKALPSLGAPVLQLHTETALDAVKIWSLGSTGFNKMWYSSANRSERHITNTVSILKAIATQDGVELDKWRLTVAKLHHINTRRKLQLARLLLTQRDDGLRRRYLWIWRLYLLRANSRRRNLGVSKRLQVDHQTQLARRYFTNWFEWYHAHQKRRLKSTYSRLLLSHANMSSVHHYFAKMQAFTRIVKAAKKRRDLVSILGLQSQRSTARNVMRKWLKFTRGRQIAARKIAFVSAMLRTSDLCLARLYFTKWGGWLQRRKVKAQRTEVCQVLLSMSAVTRRRHAYMVWRRFVLRRQALKRKQCVSAAMFATTERGLLLSYFKRWAGFRLVKIADAAAKHREETQAELDVVRARYAELGALIEEKKRLDAKEEELRQQDEELQAEDVRILRLTQTLSELEAELEEASEKSRAHRQSLAEQFATVIANLKAQVINFHQDAALIGQIRDKAKAVPVTKTFLEAHQSVKRVVVELTGKAHSAPDEPWPLTPAKLAAMPSHQLTVILQAIKTMIVSFDMMDRATRDSLQTDKEIVVNASWLLQMATRANDHRRRTLGRGALRAK